MARLESSLSKLDIKIMGKYFLCLRFDNKRLVGACIRCRTKGCKYKKTLKYYWLEKWEGKLPGEKFGGEEVYTEDNPKYQWSPKKNKWFRWYHAEDGSFVIENSPEHFRLPPPSKMGRGHTAVEGGEIDDEPSHIVLDNVE